MRNKPKRCGVVFKIQAGLAFVQVAGKANLTSTWAKWKWNYILQWVLICGLKTWAKGPCQPSWPVGGKLGRPKNWSSAWFSCSTLFLLCGETWGRSKAGGGGQCSQYYRCHNAPLTCSSSYTAALWFLLTWKFSLQSRMPSQREQGFFPRWSLHISISCLSINHTDTWASLWAPIQPKPD